MLVTGASQGLGRHFARLLASQGASVALAARQVDKLESLAKEIKSNGGRAAPVPMDVTDSASIAQAFDAAEAALGPVIRADQQRRRGGRKGRRSIRPRPTGTRC